MKHYLILVTACIAALFFTRCGQKSSNVENTPEPPGATEKAVSDEITLTDAEMERASGIYFNTCAGCHGTTRKGATGPSLLPDARTKLLTTAGLKAFMMNGTPGGMPDWGKQGILNDEEMDLLARFLQVPPPPIPEYTLDNMKASWKVLVPVEDRPTKPEHDRNWQNFFGVILRDAGQVAIIDGDTKEMISIAETGFAVHILRSSASGRYFYSIGRDGKVTLIDNWMAKPSVVAECKGSFDARSVDVSKYKGPKGDFIDKYVIMGGYTPSHFVIMDALTLEPLTVVSTSGEACDNGEYLEEARVAAIVASHKDPLWVVNVKETGMVWLVDYTNVANPEITKIKTARYLHDGGWDNTGQYFLVAANASNKMVVVDVTNKKLETIIETGIKPHPGRGANVNNKEHGNLYVTGHLGENKITFIATAKGDNQWNIVKNLELPGAGGGNLFVKTHPKSNHLWADRALNNEVSLQRSIFVVDNQTLETIKTIEVPQKYQGRAVHLEYNKAGDEVWVSVWGKMDKPAENAILVYDDKTMELKNEITGDWVITPTGKFNVFNTMHDIY
ncbi:MAG: nitrite reductase [Cyclobacteriaceae bacterium]|nr:nitrite reductase [Cyclobacteriaceae bacterium]